MRPIPAAITLGVALALGALPAAAQPFLVPLNRDQGEPPPPPPSPVPVAPPQVAPGPGGAEAPRGTPPTQANAPAPGGATEEASRAPQVPPAR